jgi:predicted transcriptional regulator
MACLIAVEEGEAHATHIMYRTRLNPATSNRCIQDLVSKGLLVENPAEGNGRIKHVYGLSGDAYRCIRLYQDLEKLLRLN